ncbi:hypothetical protein OSH10_00620 [Kaistia defluvii]|uniref:hypothetical protein n=1 Tax=Kaistia defluvii TaxID=410841 RepID=UPI0022526A40|nr:hypothetical protein [Kaistia defluvii]MCX5516925.1 hypothetical protein [Kaistia defluvii]
MEIFVSVISVLVGIVGLVWVWQERQRAELRTGDVFSWSNEVISVLQSLVLISSPRSLQLEDQLTRARIIEIMFRTSILIEQGRLLFMNEVINDWGSEKPSAYRGYRPEILDHIVVAHQISAAWVQASEEERFIMGEISKDCLMNFVSLAQKEIGRSKTISVDGGRSGDGADLDYLMSESRDARAEALI